LRRHQRRKIGRECRAKDDPEASHHDAHGVQQLDAQQPQGCRRGDAQQQEGTYDIGGDQHGPPPDPVDPDAGDQPEQDAGQVVGGAQGRHLPGRRLKEEGGGERQRQVTDLRTQIGDGLAGQHFDEVGVAPEGARWTR